MRRRSIQLHWLSLFFIVTSLFLPLVDTSAQGVSDPPPSQDETESTVEKEATNSPPPVVNDPPPPVVDDPPPPVVNNPPPPDVNDRGPPPVEPDATTTIVTESGQTLNVNLVLRRARIGDFVPDPVPVTGLPDTGQPRGSGSASSVLVLALSLLSVLALGAGYAWKRRLQV